VQGDPILRQSDWTVKDYRAAPSAIQGAQPGAAHHAINLDGTQRVGGFLGFQAAGNPFESAWRGTQTHNSVWLATGGVGQWQVDVALNADGPTWVIGRTYNSLQHDGAVDSNGYQGRNWFQMAQPEIQLVEHPTSDAFDTLYLIHGVDRFAEFERADATSDSYVGTNGATGVFVRVAGATGQPDVWTYTDTASTTYAFYGFDGDAGAAAGQIWKKTDAAGESAYAGHASDAAQSIVDGYESGRLRWCFDSESRRFEFMYSAAAVGGAIRLESVVAHEQDGASWSNPGTITEVTRVEYGYVTTGDAAAIGNLQQVVTVSPLSSAGVNETRVLHYRYWDATAPNPGGLKYMLDAEASRQADLADNGSLDQSLGSMSDSTIGTYAAGYWEYDSNGVCDLAAIGGGCGCSGNSQSGLHTYSYSDNPSYVASSSYNDTQWKSRAIVGSPEGRYLTQYFDEVGQCLSVVESVGHPATATENWTTKVVRGADSTLRIVGTPAGTVSYNHGDGSSSLNPSSGLIWLYLRHSTGALSGFMHETRFFDGLNDPGSIDFSLTLDAQALAVGDSFVQRPIVTEQWAYGQSTLTAGAGPGATVSNQSFLWHAGTLMPSETTVTLPAVSANHHGSGLALTRKVFTDQQGRDTWTQDSEGILSYTQYEQGRVVQRVDDADTGQVPSGDVPAGWASTGGAFHRVSTMTYDRAGEENELHADGSGVRSHVTRLADGRRVNLRVPYSTVGGLVYGVTSVSFENQAGYDEASGALATSGFATVDLTALVSTTETDPLTSLNTSGVARWSTKVYGLGGTQMTESRSYFLIPATGAGTQGANYDATSYTHNDAGEVVSTTAPYGTVTWDIYDGKGRITQRWVGTNAEGMDSGGPTGAGDMTMTGSYQYDHGIPGGNSLLTHEVRRFEETSTDEQVTSYGHDARGNLLGTHHHAAPHSVNKLDSLGRVVASATFDSTASYAAAIANGASAVTMESGRLSYSESFYDSRGQLYQSIRHKLNAAGQSIDILVSDMWHDDGGHSIKSHGARMSKTYYDRLGRKTHGFDLAEMEADVDDTGANSVAGNVVMQETQTVYESSTSNRVLMNVTIGRWPGDNGTGATLGALDSNSDGNALTVSGPDISGRYQINAYWYDELGRRTESVQLGTNDREVFYRDGLSTPQRSDTVLRTSWTYNTDGTLQQVKSPKRIKNRYEYDQLGRTVKFTENYVDGSPNATYPDEDRITRYVYTNGLRTSYILEQASGDQTTTYIYGTTKGAVPDSKIATGHLLARVSYPLASSGTQPESSFAYDVQERTFWKKDAAGTKRQYEFHDSGRLHKDIALELGSGVDSAVRMREYAYDVRGQMTDAIQYGDTAGVTATDSTQFEFDEWGNTSKASTDPDSEMGGTGAAAYDIDYGYEKAALGRRTVRPTTITYPSGEGFQFLYDGADYNNFLSRPNSMEEVSTNGLVANWDYLGWGQIVGMSYPDANVSMTMLGAGGTSLPSLDRFGRRTKLRWDRPLPSGNVTLLNLHYGYDWDSYLTSSDDKVMDGFDEQLTIDGLGRIKTYERGAQTAGGFTDRTYRMERGFDSLGNMLSITVDRDGDGLFTGIGESSETRSFNGAGEIVTRTSLDPGVGNPTWYADGAMDSSGEGQKSTYDAWGNLVRVAVDGTSDVVLELRRDALNRIISQHADETGDGLATGADTTYNYLPDRAGRALAVFRQGLSTPRLERLFAGPESLTGSRESRDDDGDGTVDRITYVLPDATGSAAGFFDLSTGQMERVHYNPMGVPTCLPSGDINGDGKTDEDDYVLLRDDVATQTYDEKSDVNADGLVDVWDAADYEPKIGGTGVLSLTGNTLGLHQMPRVNESYLAGARTFSESLGRWTSKDPSGYVDGPSLYQGMRGNVFSFMDRGGLEAEKIQDWRPGEGQPPKVDGEPRVRFESTGTDEHRPLGANGPGVSSSGNSNNGAYLAYNIGIFPREGFPGLISGCDPVGCGPCKFDFTIVVDIEPWPQTELEPYREFHPDAKWRHSDNAVPLKPLYGNDHNFDTSDYGFEGTDPAYVGIQNNTSEAMFRVTEDVPCGAPSRVVISVTPRSKSVLFRILDLNCPECPSGSPLPPKGGGFRQEGPSTPGPGGTLVPGPHGPGVPSPIGPTTPGVVGPEAPGPGDPSGPDGPWTPGHGRPGTPVPSLPSNAETETSTDV
jgi:RHS repeat-associated protein